MKKNKKSNLSTNKDNNHLVSQFNDTKKKARKHKVIEKSESSEIL